MKNLNELAHKIHESNKLRGFDVAQDNIGQSLMLIVGEIGEAMDAHQCGRFAKAEYENINADMEDGVFSFAFGLFIKNTFEDELADIVIRTLDFCAAFGVDIEQAYRKTCISYYDNIGEMLLYCTDAITTYKKSSTIYGTMQCVYIARPIHVVEKIAKFHDINLEKHIALKMRYNETRPYKHGKRY